MVTVAMKLKDAFSLEDKLWPASLDDGGDQSRTRAWEEMKDLVTVEGRRSLLLPNAGWGGATIQQQGQRRCLRDSFWA